MTRYHVFLLGWVLLMVVGPAAFTQFPGGGGPPGGFGKGKGGFGRGADGLFTLYSKGADTFDVSKVEVPEFMARFEPAEKLKERMMTFLQKKGVTNGIMTRELFSEFTQEAFREMGKRMTESSFQKLAGGRDRFNVDTVVIPQEMQRFESADSMKAKMKQFLASKGVNDGQMTLDLFQEYSESRRRDFGERFAKGGDKGGDRGGPPSPGGASSDAEVEQRARENFDAIDTNKDGKLSIEELQAGQQNRLRGTRVLEVFDQYDKNKDKLLDFEEYKSYLKDRMGGDRGRDRDRGPDSAAPPVPEEDKRPTVYRYGKLPKELPSWFSSLDTDLDAQVGLYEWKKAGRSVKEFLEYDTNGDGFLTVEELLRVERAKLKKTGETTTSGVAFGPNPGAAGPGPAAAGGPPIGGGMGRGMGPGMWPGRGGFGGGGEGMRPRIEMKGRFGDKGGNGGNGMEWMMKGRREKGGKGGRPRGSE